MSDKARVSLFDLSKDVAEAEDLSNKVPQKLAELTKLHDVWLAEMPNPIKAGGKKWTAGAPQKAKKLAPEQKKKARDEERKKKKVAK